MPEEGHDYADDTSLRQTRGPEDELDLTSLQLVNVMLSDARTKARTAAVGRQTGLHSQLRLHELEPIPSSAKALLGKDKAAAPAAAASVQPAKGKGVVGAAGGGAGARQSAAQPGGNTTGRKPGMLAPPV